MQNIDYLRFNGGEFLRGVSPSGSLAVEHLLLVCTRVQGWMSQRSVDNFRAS